MYKMEEVPEIYHIDFLLPGTSVEKLSLDMDKIETEGNLWNFFGLPNYYKRLLMSFYKTSAFSLESELHRIERKYLKFLLKLPRKIGPYGEEDWCDDFTSIEDFRENIDFILDTAKEGDLLYIGDRVYYISGFDEKRLAYPIPEYDNVDGLVLPEVSQKGLFTYGAHSLDDIRNLYLNEEIKNIMIDHKIWRLNNKESIYPNTDVIKRKNRGEYIYLSRYID